MTGRLSEFCAGLHALRADAVDALDDREFVAFINIACDLFGHEAARLFLGGWIRDLQDDEEHAA